MGASVFKLGIPCVWELGVDENWGKLRVDPVAEGDCDMMCCGNEECHIEAGLLHEMGR